MAEPTIQLGGGNWAGKSDNLLGYYKEGERFYKQDFTFSRSTTGTYTDSEGYIQEMPYNLLQYSEDFSQWSLNTSGISSIEANYAASPEGLQNAYKVNFIVQSDSDLSLSRIHTITGGSTYVYSIYIKGEGTNIGKDVVIKSKRQGGGDSAGTTTTQTLTNEWKRINFTTTYAANNINGRLLISSNDATSCLIYGAQAEEGTSAKTYFPTTTRLNMPRVDYLNNSNGSLILEPQRANLFTDSEGTGNFSTFGRANCTYSSGSGFNSFQSSCSVDVSVFSNSKPNSVLIYNAVSGDTNLFSFFIKKKSGFYAKITNGNATNSFTIDLDLSDGSVINTTGTAIGNTNIIQLSDNCFRVEFLTSANSTTSAGLINVRFYDNSSFADWSNTDDDLSFFISGLQLESNESYATSYIPTSGSSVTRNADVCTDGGDASRFNDNEGVLYAEIAALEETSSSSKYISISDETYNNRLSILFSSGATNQIRAFLRVGGTPQVDFNGSVTDVTDYNKVAFKYKANDFALWINGVEVATDTSGSVFSADTLTKLSFSEINTTSGKFEGKVKDLKVYNTALTDSELQALTTL